MVRFLCGLLAAGVAALTSVVGAFANPQLAYVPDARVNMEMQKPFTMKAQDLDHQHEITVYLPASYHSLKDRTYPVLWVLDAPLMLRTVVGIQDTLVLGNMAPEMIIVGVGSRSEEGLAGVGRRVIDFSPLGEDYYPEGLRGEVWEEIIPTFDFPHQANDFLNFLIDDVRPRLERRYRFSGEHALFGHSAGGMFAAYSLFARPSAFDKYIIGSPYVTGVGGAVFNVEELYAAENNDLDAKIFLGAGSAEVSEYFLAASGIVSGTVDFAERLRLRQYPSLSLTTEIYSGENHYTVVPRVLSDGIRKLSADEAKALGSSWPQPPQ